MFPLVRQQGCLRHRLSFTVPCRSDTLLPSVASVVVGALLGREMERERDVIPQGRRRDNWLFHKEGIWTEH